MSKEPLQKKSNYYTKFRHFWKSRTGHDEPKFTIVDKQLYYDKTKNTFYVKVVSISGLLCRDVIVDDMFLPNSTFLKSLDKDSLCFIYYLAGKLEDLANKDHNSLFTFHGISPKNPSIFLVKSLIDMSIHEWEIDKAYLNNLHYNLDKPSIARFMERYFIVKQLNIKSEANTHLQLVK
ncbi:MAG: hypothetical protein LW807_07245 [Proteobacteria bacterium]|jgi:hypothetical protein|nr:hypothetical protein [Pseudomonadota bacterium]